MDALLVTIIVVRIVLDCLSSFRARALYDVLYILFLLTGAAIMFFESARSDSDALLTVLIVLVCAVLGLRSYLKLRVHRKSQMLNK